VQSLCISSGSDYSKNANDFDQDFLKIDHLFLVGFELALSHSLVGSIAVTDFRCSSVSVRSEQPA
jgi:hypothetical protein